MEKYELIHRVELAEKVAWKMYGQPYRWGGDDTIIGFDCSGMCIEILKSVGILPRQGDWTANGLWEKFKDKPKKEPCSGCLAFWWNSAKTKIVHVEYCLDDKHTIGASGGGSATVTREAAAKHNAFVKVRPIRKHNLAGFLDPFR